jgi:hypothetical protein
MTRDELARALSAIEQRLASRVEIVRVIIDPDGREVGRIHRGWFNAPPDWEPPFLKDLVAHARVPPDSLRKKHSGG